MITTYFSNIVMKHEPIVSKMLDNFVSIQVFLRKTNYNSVFKNYTMSQIKCANFSFALSLLNMN